MTIAVALRPARPERRAFTIADLERMTEVGILDPDERLVPRHAPDAFALDDLAGC